jgi:SAM-dependent methyltransferase
MSDFDRYAESYDAALHQGLALTGEKADYFAQERVLWSARRIRAWRPGGAPRAPRVLDFGCGTGASVPMLAEAFAASEVVGTDESSALLARARAQYETPTCRFSSFGELSTCQFDVVYCNGVFHHVLPSLRVALLKSLRRHVRDDGFFCLWENNPLNPGTRLVMSRIPFDRDAVLMWPRTARRLLADSGFTPLATEYLFFFPAFAKSLRRFERRLAGVPLGGQYVVLAQASCVDRSNV